MRWERFIKVKVTGECVYTSLYLDALRFSHIDVHTVTCHDEYVTFFIALRREDTFLKCVSTRWVMTIVGEAEVVKKSESTNQYAFHAPKKGLITSVIVYQDKKCVDFNQVVERGDLLITGELNVKLDEEDQPDSAQESVRVPIHADLMLNTWLRVTGSYYTQALYQTVNTKSDSYYQLRLNDWTLPLTFHRDSSEQQVITEKVNLPKLALRLEEVWSTTPYKVEKKQTQTDLYQLAQKQLRQRILSELHVEQIYDEKILHQSIENGKVNVTVFFSVLETYHID